MAYASVTDILAYTGRGDRILSRNSPISLEDVDGFINDIGAEIDGVLFGLDIEIPFASGDAPRSWGLLKRINTLGAAAQLELRLFGEAAPGSSVRDSRASIYRAQYDKLLVQLQDGSVRLMDLANAPSDDSDLAYLGGEHDESGYDKEPYFKRDSQF